MSQPTNGAADETLPPAPADGNWSKWAADLTPAQREHLRRALLFDTETGFFTREYFAELLQAELDRSKRYQRIVSLALIRLDDYEIVKAERGQPGIDLLMKHAAEMLKARIRDVDVAGRFSTNELAIIMPETDGMAGAMVASRVCNNITANAPQEGQAALCVSVGVASFPHDAKDFTDLVFWARTDMEPHPC